MPKRPKGPDSHEQPAAFPARVSKAPPPITPLQGMAGGNWRNRERRLDNPGYWLGLPTLTVHEATCLLIDVDPDDARPDDGPRHPSIRDTYWKTRRAVDRSTLPREGTQLVTEAFVQWGSAQRFIELPAYWPAIDAQPTGISQQLVAPPRAAKNPQPKAIEIAFEALVVKHGRLPSSEEVLHYIEQNQEQCRYSGATENQHRWTGRRNRVTTTHRAFLNAVSKRRASWIEMNPNLRDGVSD